MKSLFVGQNIMHLESTDSTNSYAAELLRKNNLPEGSVINCFNQTNGRGQRGNSWESEPNKNATLSIILYPTFLSADKQFLLTKIISLAVTDLMTEIIKLSDNEPQVRIKWPNDIYVNDKKIAGILIENILSGNTIKSTILGIGININQTVFNSITNATSLALIAGKTFDLMEIIGKLCEYAEARYLQLKANRLESIDTEYLQRLYQLNEWKNYSSSNEIFEGRIINVSKDGKLKIELKSKIIREFSLKEIKFI